MDRMKTLFKYVLLLVVFFVFSEFLINVGLNSSYKNMQRKDSDSQIEITQAQSTLVNGRISGTIKNCTEESLAGKYVKIDFYSKRDILVGTKYIEINTTQTNTTQDFKAFFELKDVTSYKTSIVDTKEGGEIDLIPKELTKPEVVVLTAITLLIFWG